jgi:hypothetical protein
VGLYKQLQLIFLILSFTLLVLTTCVLHILSEAVAILVQLKFSYIVYFLFDEKALLINSRLP